MVETQREYRGKRAKKCSKCEQVKPETAFDKHSNGNRRGVCRQCVNEARRKQSAAAKASESAEPAESKGPGLATWGQVDWVVGEIVTLEAEILKETVR